MTGRLVLDDLPDPAARVCQGTVVETNLRGRAIAAHADVAAAIRDLRAEESTTVTLPGDSHGWPRILDLRAGRQCTNGDLIVTLEDVTVARRLAAVVDATADSTFVLDAGGRMTWQSEGLRQRIGDVADAGIVSLSRVHPDDLPLAMERLASVLAAEDGHRDRMNLRSRATEDDERWEWIEVTSSRALDEPLLGGVVLQVHNLDEGRQVDDLARAEGDLRSLADAAPVGLIVADHEGSVIYRTELATKILGAGGDHLAHHAWCDWVAPSHVREFARFLGRVRVGEPTAPVTIHVTGPTADRWVVVTASPLRDRAGGRTGVVVAVSDVTEEVEVRTEANGLTRMLEASADLVLVVEPDLTIRYANAAARAALGTDDPLAATLLALVEPDVGSRATEDARQTLATGGSWRAQIPVRVADGNTLTLSVLAVAGRSPDGHLETIGLIGRDISGLKQAEARLRHLADHDELTGLLNRRELYERAGVVLAGPESRSLAVLFADLDGFKAVNDHLGHRVGDQVLRVVADRIRNRCREGDLVARVGGDEFVVIRPRVGTVEQARAMAERLVAAVSEPIDIDGCRVQVGLSLGVVLVGPVLADVAPAGADALIRQADDAMYRSKAIGTGRPVVVLAG